MEEFSELRFFEKTKLPKWLIRFDDFINEKHLTEQERKSRRKNFLRFIGFACFFLFVLIVLISYIWLGFTLFDLYRTVFLR